MKNIFLICALFLVSLSKAQPYNFAISQANYQPLANATSLNQTLAWDDPVFVVDPGFPVQIYQQTYNVLYLNGLGGWVNYQESPLGFQPWSILMGLDITDRGYDFSNSQANNTPGSSESALSYKTEGQAPNRILKIEFQNVGFYDEGASDNVFTDFANFQFWFYEAGGILEVRFGNSSISNPESSFSGEVGAFYLLSPDFDAEEGISNSYYQSLTGNAQTATIASQTDINNLTFTEGIAAANTVYRFIPSGNGISAFKKALDEQGIYPTLARDVVNLPQVAFDKAQVLSANGSLVASFETGTTAIDVSQWPQGAYWISFLKGDEVYSQKFVKQ
ncbi:MAG TPA: T9SS type A sorting domain-containing protein [Luteibaculaceae bacterium]|nr:T9SS type A sorting domain-containing protein [Luteibaculaceae bacterium]